MTDASATLTGGVDLVVPEDEARGGLLLQNCSAHDILFVLNEIGAAAPASITAGAAGVYCLGAASSAGKQGGSYEPDAGYIPTNAIYAKGTASDVLVCSISKKP